MRKSDFVLSEFSIRLSAVDPNTQEHSEHDFFSLHPKLMVQNGIVPNDWKWDKDELIVQTDSLLMEYQNGVRFFGNSVILDVAQTQNLKFGEEYAPPDLVIRYVASMAQDVFIQAGMEWTILVPHDDPFGWITNRFFRPEIVSEEWEQVQFIPMMRFVVDDEIAGYSFFVQEIAKEEDQEGDEQEMLAVVCRLGFSQVDNDAELSRWILNWRTHEKSILSILMFLMGVENGLD